MLLLPKFLAGFSGVVVETAGYESFFIGTALLGVPVLALVWLATRSAAIQRPPSTGSATASVPHA